MSDLELQDGEDLMLISLKGKQLAIVLKPHDLQMMDEETENFCQRFIYPCLRKLAEEILHA